MKVLVNAINVLMRREFRLVDGEYGSKATVTGEWNNDIFSYIQTHQISELELNYVRGFKFNGDSPEFLARLPHLMGLDVVYAPFTDLSPINHLSRLKYLNLGFSRSSRALKLENCPELEKLAFEWFKGADGLFKLYKLRELALFFYPGKDTSEPFSRFTQLEELRLSMCGLSEIEHFCAMNNLKRLELLCLKHLSSLRGIEVMGKLKKLRIEGCPNFASLNAIRNLRSLEFLWLYDCGEVDSIEPLCDLHELREINIGGNTNIVDGNLSVLTQLPKLESIGLVERKHYTHSWKKLKDAQRVA